MVPAQGGLRRPAGLAVAVATRDSAAGVRRDHHRRGRARPRCGVLPCGRARHHPHGRAREELDRRRQHRPQHHHRPVQLPVRRKRAALQPRARPVAGHVAGPQLQRDVLAARRHDARARRARRAGAQAPRACESLQRRDQRMAEPGRGESVLPAAQHRAEHPLPGARCRAAASRRHCPSRCRGLGLCSRGRCARRRYHRELRGHGNSPRRQRCGRGRRDVARSHQEPQDRRVGSRLQQRRDRPRRRATADRELPAAGARVRAGQAGRCRASSCRTPSTPTSASPTRASS